MQSSKYLAVAASLLAFSLCVSAREMVLPAGTLLQCTMNEPNFSSATVAVGDPVLCHLHSVTEFGQQAFPRGSYLVGHLEAAQNPGHFWGKGFMKVQFDRIGMPQGDMPLDAKVVSTRGYKVDREGDIRGKGHAKRDVVEWMLPPLWPWKILMLPARGPRPTLKGEAVLSLRLMDDVQIPQVHRQRAELALLRPSENGERFLLSGFVLVLVILRRFCQSLDVQHFRAQRVRQQHHAAAGGSPGN